jgi:hypothetical protein
MPARPGRLGRHSWHYPPPGSPPAHHGGTNGTRCRSRPGRAGIFTESGLAQQRKSYIGSIVAHPGMAAPKRRAGMPGRLEPLRQREGAPRARRPSRQYPRSARGQGRGRGLAGPGSGCDPQQEIFLARQIRAGGLVAGLQPGQIAARSTTNAARPPGPAGSAPTAGAGDLARRRGRARSGPGTSARAGPCRGSARRCCPPTRAARNGRDRSISTTCARYTGPTRPTSATPIPAFCGRGHGEERLARAPAGPGAAARAARWPIRPPRPAIPGPPARARASPWRASWFRSRPAAISPVASRPAPPCRSSWPMPAPRTMTTWSGGCCCG